MAFHVNPWEVPQGGVGFNDPANNRFPYPWEAGGVQGGAQSNRGPLPGQGSSTAYPFGVPQLAGAGKSPGRIDLDALLNPIEEKERGALSALGQSERFRRGRATRGIASLTPYGSKLPGVMANIRANLLAGSFGRDTDRRAGVLLGQQQRRAKLGAADLFGGQEFEREKILTELRGRLNAESAEAGGPSDFDRALEFGSTIGTTIALL